MNTKTASVLQLCFVIVASACAGTARAENVGAAAPGELSAAHPDPKRDSAAPDAGNDDDSRPPEHLRVGVLGGVGFPRPLAIEGLIKLERVVAIGAEYGLLPNISVAGVDISFWAVAADLRVFPLRDGFFIGMRVGHQHLGGHGSLMINGYGTVEEALAIETTFVNPRIGFLWTWDPGITLGVDAGAQFPLASKVSSTLPQGNAATDQVMSVASSFGKNVLPTIDLLRLGVML